MCLMRYSKVDYIDTVATCTIDAASSWLSHEQEAMEQGTCAPWQDWEEFHKDMIWAFEPTTDDTQAQQQLAALK